MIQQAFISGQIGKVIYEEDGQYFILNVEQPEVSVECRPMDVSAFFNYGAEFTALSGTRLDLAHIKTQLITQRQAYTALTLTINGLDDALDHESRTWAIQAAERLVKKKPTHQFVRARMLARPLPEEADIEVAKDIADHSNSTLLYALYQSLDEYELAISLIYETWIEAAPDYFSSNEELAESERLLVDLGFFAEVVTAVAKDDFRTLNSVILTYSQNPELNNRLRQWRFIFNDLRARLVKKWATRFGWPETDVAQSIESYAAENAYQVSMEGIVAAETAASDIDGISGSLIYQGYNIHDLVQHSTFEEVIYLLWHGHLPKFNELDNLRRAISDNYSVHQEVLHLMQRIPRNAEPMDVLRTAVSALAFYDNNSRDLSHQGALRTAVRLTAQLPMLVAAWDRIRRGQEAIAAKPNLNIATNFLYMLKGEMPPEREAHILDACLILHADHELSTSTFAARVVAGTLADMYGAVTAAIAALSGQRHGRASTYVMKMLIELDSVGGVEEVVLNALIHGKRIKGIGHAVYTTEDPRATDMRRFSQEMAERQGDTRWFEILEKLRGILFREEGLYPNVSYYSGLTYYMMGIPLDLFTPIFAVSRVSGWTRHILEQYKNNRLIRPRAVYVGPRDVRYVPIEQRGAKEFGEMT
jgi:citrate synthase